jgi:hypothetical protein
MVDFDRRTGTAVDSSELKIKGFKGELGRGLSPPEFHAGAANSGLYCIKMAYHSNPATVKSQHPPRRRPDQQQWSLFGKFE